MVIEPRLVAIFCAAIIFCVHIIAKESDTTERLN